MTMPVDLDAEIAALEQHLAEPAYTAEDLQHAEGILRQAFGDGFGQSHSPAGVFAGARSKARDESLYRSRRLPERLVEAGYPEHLTSTWATRVHASASSRARFSRPPISDSPVTDSSINTPRVHAIVNSLPEPHLLLIRAEFMRPGPMRVAFAKRLLLLAWTDYAPRIAAGLDRRALVHMAEAVIASQGRPDKYLHLQMRDRLEISPSNWSTRYVIHWRALLADYEVRRTAALTAFLLEFDR